MEIIYEKIKAFEKDYDDTEINKALSLRSEFLKTFPKEKLLSLTEENYVIGLDSSKESFCYWLGTKLRPLGKNYGSSSLGFAVHYGKKGTLSEGKRQWSKWAKGNFDTVRKELYDLIIAGEKKDYDKIEKNKLSPMFKGKILATYFPDNYLPVLGYVEINLCLKKFKVYESLSIERAKSKLLEIKNSNALMKNWDNYKFMRFCYDSLLKPIVIRRVQQSTEELREDAPEIIGRKLLIIDDSKDYFRKERTELESKKPYKPDYIKISENRNRIGEAGENAVFEYEKKRLSDAGRNDLAVQIEWISKSDDSLGYDIKSYDESTGKEIHIEVKTTESCASDTMSFYLTVNELKRLKEDEMCRIYYVFCINKESPKIRVVNKEKLISNFDKLANPVLYRIDCELK